MRGELMFVQEVGIEPAATEHHLRNALAHLDHEVLGRAEGIEAG